MKVYLLFIVMLLASCTSQTTVATKEVVQPKSADQITVVPSDIPSAIPEKTDFPLLEEQGLRLPDLLTLPSDESLQSFPPSAAQKKSPIIARPPQE